jgi:L-threonylcarbamoyladenylate synthase
MTVVRVDPAHPDEGAIRRAAEVLRAGGLVAFPTETVYGLGAHALDPAAVARIYAAKGRPSYNPVIVHVATVAQARALSGAWPQAAERLAAAFWPGPLTLVVPRAPSVPDAVTAGLPDVALRIPAHPVAHALLSAAGIPVAAPSANRSTEVSPTTAAHVERSLGGRVDLILDGGPTPVGIESTVVSVTGAVPTLLRPGTLSRDDLAAVVGAVALAGEAKRAEGAALPSPGTMDRHYAPRAQLRLWHPNERDASLSDARALVAAGRAVGILSRSDVSLAGARVERMPADPASYAARLYAALHDMDDAARDVVLVERVPEDEPVWAGLADRLRRAAHH